MYTGVHCDLIMGIDLPLESHVCSVVTQRFSLWLCLASELTTTQTSVCRGKECMGIHIKSPKKMTDTYEFAH